MRSSPFSIIFAAIMLLLDLYVFQIIKVLSINSGIRTKSLIFTIYWLFSFLSVVILFLLPLFENLSKGTRSIIFSVIIGVFLGKLIASVFFLVDDLRRGIQWMAA